MIYEQPVSENLAYTVGKLGRERYFRHKIKHLVAGFHHRVDQTDIYFGFSASGYAVEQHDVFLSESIVDFIIRFLLGCREYRHGIIGSGDRGGEAVDAFFVE